MKIDFHTIDEIFQHAFEERRFFLFEHEVYGLLRSAGIKTPAFRFIPRNGQVREKELSVFKGDRLVMKIVSPRIVHKSDVGGVAFVARSAREINRSAEKMLAEVAERFVDGSRAPAGGEAALGSVLPDLRGILLCEAVSYEQVGFGSEILLGLRSTRDFGPVVTLGGGGTDVELLNDKLKPGRAAAVGSASLLASEDIIAWMSPLAVYEKTASRFRGRKVLVRPEKLEDLCRRFCLLGSHYSAVSKQKGFVIEEMEVNPFVISGGEPIPLDGMCRFSRDHSEEAERPVDQIDALLHPDRIGIIGVSEKMNLGRIILKNILDMGFPADKIWVVKPGVDTIEKCRCVPRPSDLPESVDLFVLTVAADQSFSVLSELIENGKASSVIIIAGGMGEKEGTETLARDIRDMIRDSRLGRKPTPVINGGNCLGILSAPGRYDTTFIPKHKLYDLPRPAQKASPLVLLSQSGAFMMSRLSRIPGIAPRYAVSIGNQLDLTLADYMKFLRDDAESRIFAVYIEGFLPGDGLAFARAAREITCQEGKSVVVYKAGRSPEGRAATASHTASVAGDYAAAHAVLSQAGVIMTDSLEEFENFVKVLCFLENKRFRGSRVGLISNAGFECVILSDNLKNDDELIVPAFTPETVGKLSDILKPVGIDRLQDIHNPLDVTPLADDGVFAACCRAILEDGNIDCAVLCPLPLSPSMNTLAASLRHREDMTAEGGICRRLRELYDSTDKPFVVCLDAGANYRPMADLLESWGIPVFHHSDAAMRFLRRCAPVLSG